MRAGRKPTHSWPFVDRLLLSVLRLTSDFAFVMSVPQDKGHERTFPRAHTCSVTGSKLLGGGCSHNIVSLRAYFCSSKSGFMFVDSEGGTV